jgi:hypothetical protein
MTFLLRQGFRRRQPNQVISINRRNPITKGLVIAINGHYSYDVARQLIPDINTNTHVLTNEGACLNFDGTSTKRHQYYTSPIETGSMTMFSFVRPNALSGVIMGFHFLGDGTINNYIDYNFLSSDGPFRAFINDIGGSASVSTVGTYLPDKFHKVLASFDIWGLAIRVDNAPEEIVYAGVEPSFLNTFALGGKISRLDVPSLSLAGQVKIGLVWNRVLSSQEKDSIMANPDQVFNYSYEFNHPIALRQQFARPIGVPISAGSWLGSPAGAFTNRINEQAPDLSNYIYTVDAGTCEINAGSVTNPVSVINNKVRHWIQADNGAIKVSLMQGTTVIASWTYDPAPSIWTLMVQTLSAGEAGAITDHSSLTYKIEAY